MITLFTIPRAFAGESALPQRNALRSWRRLLPQGEIVLFGDDPGVREAAAEFGVRHEPSIAKNEYGTPLVADAFAQAGRTGAGRLLAFVNADIVLDDDFLSAAARLPDGPFLAAGSRIDLDVGEAVDLDSGEGRERFRRDVASRGVPHPPQGSDWFLFPKGALPALPPFAVGRPGWDTWLIGFARAAGLPVIDASAAVTAVHQNHGYGHVAPGSRETERHLELAGGRSLYFVLDDATQLLTADGLVPADEDRHLARALLRDPGAALGRRLRHRAYRALWAARPLMPERFWRKMAYGMSTRMLRPERPMIPPAPGAR